MRRIYISAVWLFFFLAFSVHSVHFHFHLLYSYIYTAPIYVCGVSVFVTRGLRSRSRLSLGYIICSTDTWNCLANVLSEKSRRRLYKIQQIYLHSKQYIFRMPDRHQHVILLSLFFFTSISVSINVLSLPHQIQSKSFWIFRRRNKIVQSPEIVSSKKAWTM